MYRFATFKGIVHHFGQMFLFWEDWYEGKEEGTAGIQLV